MTTADSGPPRPPSFQGAARNSRRTFGAAEADLKDRRTQIVWCEPIDGPSDALRASVDQLLTRYRGHLESARADTERQVVWGVGSAPGPDGRWNHELVLVAAEALGADSGLTVGRYAAADVRAQLSNSAVWSVLRDWPITPTTVIDVTTRPFAAAAVQLRDVIRETLPPSRTATVGLPCTITATTAPAIITAGHLVSGAGVGVDILASGHGSPTWIAGNVVHWSDPIGGAGYDYAVVELLDQQHQVLAVTHTGVAAAPQSPYAPIDVDVHGAMTQPPGPDQRGPDPARRSRPAMVVVLADRPVVSAGGSVTPAASCSARAARTPEKCWGTSSVDRIGRTSRALSTSTCRTWMRA
jgi:hypothetical protein